MSKYSEGDKVSWAWGQGRGEGTVKKVYTDDVTRTIKGTEVSRNASEEDPAYFIEQNDGDEVLKGHSELQSEE